jgi:hypothetical protein
MRILFSVTLRKEDGAMVQQNVIDADAISAVQKMQAAVGGATTLISVSTLGKVDLE